MTNKKELIISLKNITHWYDREKIILKNINFNIHKNEIIIITGPNGSGKSTLLKIIIGLLKAKTGEVYFTDKKNKYNKISYVAQKNKLDCDFPIKIKELLIMGLIGSKIWNYFNKSKQIKALNKILKLFDLQSLKNKSIKSISGGQLQKVLIARGIISNPEILFLDEPSQYLDKKSKLKLYKYIKSWNKNKTIIIVTHDKDMLDYFSEKINIDLKKE